jgi:hypothetical protein
MNNPWVINKDLTGFTVAERLKSTSSKTVGFKVPRPVVISVQFRSWSLVVKIASS